MYPDDSLTLHTDLYQINMMQVYFKQNIHNKHAVFEVFFRKNPFNNGYAVFAGLERIISYLNNLTFSQSDFRLFAILGLSWRVFGLFAKSQDEPDSKVCSGR